MKIVHGHNCFSVMPELLANIAKCLTVVNNAGHIIPADVSIMPPEGLYGPCSGLVDTRCIFGPESVDRHVLRNSSLPYMAFSCFLEFLHYCFNLCGRAWNNSVLASIAGYYICNWLDGDDGDN